MTNLEYETLYNVASGYIALTKNTETNEYRQGLAVASFHFLNELKKFKPRQTPALFLSKESVNVSS